MSDGISIDVDSINQVLSNLEAFNDRLRAALVLDAQNIAREMERWTKENAKWEDRTSNARQFLKSHVKWVHTDELIVSMIHHVEYGVYLELANERKYAILEEAIHKYAPEFIEGWKQIIRESRGI